MAIFTNEEFVQTIETIAKSKNISLIDAIVHWCEKNNVEIEQVGSTVKSIVSLRTRILREAEKLSMMKVNK